MLMHPLHSQPGNAILKWQDLPFQREWLSGSAHVTAYGYVLRFRNHNLSPRLKEDSCEFYYHLPLLFCDCRVAPPFAITIIMSPGLDDASRRAHQVAYQHAN